MTAEGAVETAAAVVDGAEAAAEASADNPAVEAEEPVEPGSDKNSKE